MKVDPVVCGQGGEGAKVHDLVIDIL
jgi:hypothetical protein